jgi:integrase
MRISELADLDWRAIDFKRNVIELKDERRNKNSRQKRIPTTKGGKSRILPIHEHLLRLLKAKAANATSSKVFRAAKGGNLRANNVRQLLVDRVIVPLSVSFPSLVDEVGLKDARLHSFRHFFCSECAARGVPEQVVKSWLGHQSSAMVRRYFHLHDEESQRQIRKLDFLDETAVS